MDTLLSLLIRLAGYHEGVPLTVVAIMIAAMFWGWAVGRRNQ